MQKNSQNGNKPSEDRKLKFKYLISGFYNKEWGEKIKCVYVKY
jgi:hypothetical protein